ncbi:MAG: hypothetical protein M1840_000178 [Geoglossum simile]|nr:MAG: hypothetical protein M1840_000178 [Geoglossum simile]
MWYDDKVSYVFPRYRGSLHDLLNNGNEPTGAQKPARYRRSMLQHWLWQGMVDVVAALKFFHYPDNTQHLVQGQLIAAHFDLKPANILVDEDGSLIVTDFGQTHIKGLQADGDSSLTAQVGTHAYRPPNLK